jgi:ATP-dependent DNA ligase
MARWAARELPVTFVAFFLHLDGEDLTSRPLLERKRLLDELQLVGPSWAVNGCYHDGRPFSRSSVSLGTRASWRNDWTRRTCPAGG